jgi:type IV secretory pathway component VirB8
VRRKSKEDAALIEDRAPPAAAASKVAQQFFERFGRPVLERNRWFMLSMVQSVVVLGMLMALIGLTPLKRVQPVLVKLDSNGHATVQTLNIKNFTPTKASVRYFLGQWAEHLMILNQALTADYLTTAYEMTDGNAVAQMRTFIAKTKPIAKLHTNPQLVRHVKINTISLLPNQVAMVRLSTTTQTPGQPARHASYLLTINYEIIAPTSMDAIMTNPIGFFVTNFTLQEEGA